MKARRRERLDSNSVPPRQPLLGLLASLSSSSSSSNGNNSLLRARRLRRRAHARARPASSPRARQHFPQRVGRHRRKPNSSSSIKTVEARRPSRRFPRMLVAAPVLQLSRPRRSTSALLTAVANVAALRRPVRRTRRRLLLRPRRPFRHRPRRFALAFRPSPPRPIPLRFRADRARSNSSRRVPPLHRSCLRGRPCAKTSRECSPPQTSSRGTWHLCPPQCRRT